MPHRMHLMVCAGTGCVANRSPEVRDALVTEIAKRGLENEIQVVTTGCNGFCGAGPDNWSNSTVSASGSPTTPE